MSVNIQRNGMIVAENPLPDINSENYFESGNGFLEKYDIASIGESYIQSNEFYEI